MQLNKYDKHMKRLLFLTFLILSACNKDPWYPSGTQVAFNYRDLHVKDAFYWALLYSDTLGIRIAETTGGPENDKFFITFNWNIKKAPAEFTKEGKDSLHLAGFIDWFTYRCYLSTGIDRQIWRVTTGDTFDGDSILYTYPSFRF